MQGCILAVTVGGLISRSAHTLPIRKHTVNVSLRVWYRYRDGFAPGRCTLRGSRVREVRAVQMRNVAGGRSEPGRAARRAGSGVAYKLPFIILAGAVHT